MNPWEGPFGGAFTAVAAFFLAHEVVVSVFRGWTYGRRLSHPVARFDDNPLRYWFYTCWMAVASLVLAMGSLVLWQGVLARGMTRPEVAGLLVFVFAAVWLWFAWRQVRRNRTPVVAAVAAGGIGAWLLSSSAVLALISVLGFCFWAAMKIRAGR